MASRSEWDCPNCGKPNDASPDAYCSPSCREGIDPESPRCPGCGDLVRDEGDVCVACWAEEQEAREDVFADRAVNESREAEV